MTPEAENALLRQRIRDLEQQLARIEPIATRSLRNGVNLDRSSAEPFNSESLFRAYVETANDMVYAVDLLGRLAFINPYGERLLGRIGLDIHDGPTQHLSVALVDTAFNLTRAAATISGTEPT